MPMEGANSEAWDVHGIKSSLTRVLPVIAHQPNHSPKSISRLVILSPLHLPPCRLLINVYQLYRSPEP
jgi:hypothetical protein